MASFYEKNYQEYFTRTVTIDPASFLRPLADLLNEGDTILDIGCGSGRDLAWFAAQGFVPTGFENAPSLADLARNFSKQPVIVGDFHSYDFSTLRFNALSLVGALVHVSRVEFPEVLASICRALVPNGLILLTLKEGIGTSTADDGRVFILWSAEQLEGIFRKINLQIEDFSKQVSKIRRSDTWLSYILSKSGSDSEFPNQ